MKENGGDPLGGPSILFRYSVGLFVFFAFNPLASIYKGIEPGGDFIVAVRVGIEATLPGEDCSFDMGHHCNVTTVGRTDTGNRAF